MAASTLLQRELADVERLTSSVITLLGRLPEIPDVIADEVDDRLPEIEKYLQDFEAWRVRIEGENPLAAAAAASDTERAELRAAIEYLYEKHLEFAGRLTLVKRDVARQLGEIHQRGRALKAYIDRYPSRITVAGKRKG